MSSATRNADSLATLGHDSATLSHDEPDPQVLPESEGASPLRQMMALSSDSAYLSFRTLTDAQASEASWVIFEGDYGGQIYAVFRVAEVACSQDALTRLLADVDARYWADASGARLVFEVHDEGDGIAGGMQGGVALTGGWVHPDLVHDGLEAAIRAVVSAETERLADGADAAPGGADAKPGGAAL